jgi:hypothetical protein
MNLLKKFVNLPGGCLLISLTGLIIWMIVGTNHKVSLAVSGLTIGGLVFGLLFFLFENCLSSEKFNENE